LPGARYTGASGSISYVNKAQVQMAVHGMTMIAGNRLRRLTSEMIKRKADGTVDGTTHSHVSYDIPREFSLETAATGSAKRAVALPARQRDRQIYSTSKQAYLPFTPPRLRNADESCGANIAEPGMPFITA
jgi:hypothetical protein